MPELHAPADSHEPLPDPAPLTDTLAGHPAGRPDLRGLTEAVELLLTAQVLTLAAVEKVSAKKAARRVAKQRGKVLRLLRPSPDGG